SELPRTWKGFLRSGVDNKLMNALWIPATVIGVAIGMGGVLYGASAGIGITAAAITFVGGFLVYLGVASIVVLSLGWFLYKPTQETEFPGPKAKAPVTNNFYETLANSFKDGDNRLLAGLTLLGVAGLYFIFA